jgi:gliding motility associated protien GldN
MLQKIDDDGETQVYAPLFWLYYPECRYVFASADVFNLFNDAQRRTYEDLFQKRYFSSYIVKEANVYDRSIVEFARGMDALAESERIKEELFNLEHDLWHY